MHTSDVLHYDGLNRLTNVVDAVGQTRFTYTDASQLVSEDGPWTEDTVSYTYNARRRAGLAVRQPNTSPWTQSYGYDNLARLTNVTSAAGTFRYSYLAGASVQVHELELPSVWYADESTDYHLYLTQEYDTLARLTGTMLHNQYLNVLNQHEYQVNAANQRTRQTFTGGNYVDYTYDNIGQLQTAKGWEANTTTPRLQEQFGYAYDKAWNLQHRTNNALVQTFGVNNRNELTNATLGIAPAVARSCTPLYRRIPFGRPPERSVTLLPGDACGLQIRDTAGWKPALRARSDHSTFNLQPATAHAYYHADANGNITALVNTNGAVVARYQYDPYGNLLGMAGPLAEANTYRFSSKEWHANAGLYYYGFRYYEPNLQRWLNRDPIEEAGGFNLYGFVFNDPLCFVDEWGHSPKGHHYVPQSLCRDLPQTLQNVFDEPESRIDHLDYKDHNRKPYNGVKEADCRRAVKDELDDFLKQKGKNFKNLTPSEAREFVDRIKKKPDGPIAAYNQGVRDEMNKAIKRAARKRAVAAGAKRIGGAAARKFPVVGAGCFAYDWVNGGFGHAVDEAVWPISEIWK
ncbi:MAG: RHS repeat-associated core domain-containing protein [Verrucomicrobiae bacterium]|nr:RHS repeat-associated core domain-containing protein [Verrucomicrobiae bacterium]